MKLENSDTKTAMRQELIHNSTLQRMSANTTVVDITYICDAHCRYCRWGDSKTVGRYHQDLSDILIPHSTLENLKTKRIVLSGGEPLLHPQIDKVIRHYSNIVDDVIIITNGYGLTISKIKKLLNAGATGITISLDSIDPTESYSTRQTIPEMFQAIINNIKKISKNTRTFEFGINSTVSHVTANRATVKGILEFASSVHMDFVKFQPIFDDGYALHNSPDLLLGKRDTDSLYDIAQMLPHGSLLTNPPEFWIDLALMVKGSGLPAHSCGLGSRHASAIKDNLSMCFWIESSYGSTSSIIQKKDIVKTQSQFEIKKPKCTVDFHCFCNQRIDHIWHK